MSDQNFSLSDFDYHLPESLIAQQPAEPRDHSRLLVYQRKDQSIADDYFYNIIKYLPAQSTLVVNNSRVEKARLLFGNKEVFITKVIDPYTVEAMVRPGKRFRTGKPVTLIDQSNITVSEYPRKQTGSMDMAATSGFSAIDHASPLSVRAEVLHIAEDGLRTLRFNLPIDHPVYDPYRHTPFPPYIAPNEQLSGRYQTVFARDEGSKAAPTAGLHFTDRLLTELAEKKAVQKVELTLHVGLGTFAPVKTEQIKDHKMHSEWYRIGPDAAKALQSARFITAVGTTSARVLETAAAWNALKNPDAPDAAPFTGLHPHEQETDIFITPGYRFRAVDALLTNFHLPKSTLLMMVAAFTGMDEMHRIYRHAIDQKYRFYSFGDAMLLL